MSNRDLGMALTMEQFKKWHPRYQTDIQDSGDPTPIGSETCLKPEHDVLYREIKKRKQLEASNQANDSRMSLRAEQSAGGYRFGRRGMMGVGR